MLTLVCARCARAERERREELLAEPKTDAKEVTTLRGDRFAGPSGAPTKCAELTTAALVRVKSSRTGLCALPLVALPHTQLASVGRASLLSVPAHTWARPTPSARSPGVAARACRLPRTCDEEPEH